MSNRSERKLVLTGFMGTGKTTLAKLIAEKTNTPLIDTDEQIMDRTKLSIPSIFEQMGEAGFRAWEAAVCGEIGKDERRLVVSTGGGALMNAANRQTLEHHGTIVCLTARPEVIYERLKETGDRPLLATDDPMREIERLLQERHPVYGTFRWQVDTSDRTPEDIADEIISLWEQDEKIRAKEQLVSSPEGNYPLVIESGTLDQLHDLFEVYGLLNRRIIVATDTHVTVHYGKKIVDQLPGATLVDMPAGEAYKHLDTVNKFYTDFARLGLDRNGVVVALGGGVVGDTVGYAAASYMRGVKLVQIPTSLLAMVDSSVGGKVGVDIDMGKNLVGAFKQPDLVIIDPDVLRTLPPPEYNAGIAEVIKHGLLANPELLNKDMAIEERIRAAVQVKIEVVQRDPYEHGERAHLNLGHTFGHAIEHVSGYSWKHGDAVGVGMVAAGWLSERLGLLDSETSQMIEKVVAAAGLPTRYRNLDPEALLESMHRDKKWRDGRSHFVILRGMCQPDVVRDVPLDIVMGVLEDLHG